jgi:hypothetical protein
MQRHRNNSADVRFILNSENAVERFRLGLNWRVGQLPGLQCYIPCHNLDYKPRIIAGPYGVFPMPELIKPTLFAPLSLEFADYGDFFKAKTQGHEAMEKPGNCLRRVCSSY